MGQAIGYKNRFAATPQWRLRIPDAEHGKRGTKGRSPYKGYSPVRYRVCFLLEPQHPPCVGKALDDFAQPETRPMRRILFVAKKSSAPEKYKYLWSRDGIVGTKNEKKMKKQNLTIKNLVTLAKEFCEQESKLPNEDLFGITDGKAVGTYIEHKFKSFLLSKYDLQISSSASGIDLPSPDINTDIKVTSIKQPQSSCPFKNAQQKIFGLGYNLLVFVYDKQDDVVRKTTLLDFVSCSFVEKERTADYQTTTTLLQMLNNNANAEDIFAYLNDRNIPADEITLMNTAEEILKNPPKIGYLTISNALQWRLQYGRIVSLKNEISGITKIIDKCF